VISMSTIFGCIFCIVLNSYASKDTQYPIPKTQELCNSYWICTQKPTYGKVGLGVPETNLTNLDFAWVRNPGSSLSSSGEALDLDTRLSRSIQY